MEIFILFTIFLPPSVSKRSAWEGDESQGPKGEGEGRRGGEKRRGEEEGRRGGEKGVVDG